MNNIFFVVSIVLVIILAVKLAQMKIHIKFKTFLKRGFKKRDNKFRFNRLCSVNKVSGKTYSALSFLIDQKLKYDYIIITNVKSFDYFGDTIFLDDINRIMDFVNAHYKEQRFIIFYDEIFTILEKKSPISKKLLSFISQLRKKKIIMVTTAQEWSEINITFRRYCRYQVQCNMFAFPVTNTAYLYNIINDGDKIRWDNDLQDFIAPRIASNFEKCQKRIIDHYDTFEVINTR